MNQDLTERGGRVLEAFSSQLEQSPASSSAMLMALDFWLGPTREIVIAGSSKASDTQQMLQLIRSKFLPEAVVLFHDQGSTDPTIYEIVPFLKQQVALNGGATAYVCEDYTCREPLNSIDEFEDLLDGRDGIAKAADSLGDE